MNCDEATLSLGAYLFDALEPAERDDVDAHLLTCPTCAAELAELQALPQLLARVSSADVEGPALPVPSAELFERVARAAGGRSPGLRRPRGRWLAVAAAAVLVVGGAVGGWEASRGGPTSYSAVSGGIHMTVRASAQDGGTAFNVSVEGLPASEHCWLEAVGRDGSWHAAGEWVATWSGRAQVTGSTTVARAQLAQLVLESSSGQKLVAVTL